jgi:hypothetical protein
MVLMRDDLSGQCENSSPSISACARCPSHPRDRILPATICWARQGFSVSSFSRRSRWFCRLSSSPARRLHCAFQTWLHRHAIPHRLYFRPEYGPSPSAAWMRDGARRRTAYGRRDCPRRIAASSLPEPKASAARVAPMALSDCACSAMACDQAACAVSTS